MASWLQANLAAVVVLATVAIVIWRILARRSENQRSSGLATLLLSMVAVAVPATAAVLGVGASAHTYWWFLAVAALAAVLASTEWLRTALRIFAILAIVCLVGVLLRVGASEVVDTRCKSVNSSIAELAALNQQKTADITPDARQSFDMSLAALTDLIDGSVGTASNRKRAASVVAALGSSDSRALKTAITAFDRRYRPQVGARGDASLASALDKAVAAHARVMELEALADRATTVSTCSEASTDLPSEVDVARARFEVAAYRGLLVPLEENADLSQGAADALGQAEKDVADGKTANEFRATRLFERGAEAAGGWALSWLPGGPSPDKWFWLALTAILVLVWWLVERRSNSTVAGPVRSDFVGSEGITETPKDAQEALFSTVLTKNLREPGSTPGSASANPVTDLEGVATAIGGGPLLKSFLAASKLVLNTERGSVVKARLLPSNLPESGWKVWVSVTDAATGRSLGSREVPGESVADACRGAGYWAAATILSSSPRIPLWAKWSPSTARAFATYDTVGALSVNDLRAAALQAPASSLVLHKLADKLSLQGEFVEAVSLYARAVTVDPTDDLCAYRLAANLSALTRNGCDAWSEATYSQRVVACASLSAALRRLRIKGDVVYNSSQDDLKQIARAMFVRLSGEIGRWQTLLRYARRDQRDSIGHLWEIFARYGRQRQTRAFVMAAALTVEDSPTTPPVASINRRGGQSPLRAFQYHQSDLGRVESFARDPRSDWHVSYNLACYYALQGGTHTEQAIGWLECALTKPGIEELCGKWLRQDPDLTALQGLTRFHMLAASVTDEPKE